jgi:ATP-dependent RNA helicase DDX27
VKYRGKIRSLEAEIKQILKQEEEEKQLRLTEMEINKATNLIEHRDEIMSRPARTWIKTTGQKRAAPGDIGDRGEETGDLTTGVPSKKAKREEIKKGLTKRKNTDSVS